jgi:LacI family transcriptional regulator
LPHASFVTSDSSAIGYAGADFFLKRGFTHFAYVADAEAWDWSTLRYQAFSERLQQAGHTCELYGNVSKLERVDWSVDQQRLARWLLELPKPTAILAAHDRRARQVLETCQLAGLEVPSDIALLGVDNEDILCENTTPTLSSILPDFEAGGYEAAHLLEQLMRRTLRTPQTLFYGVKQIVSRESSRPSLISDRRFLKGIEFIRLNSSENIGVPDVAEHMGVSRRMAEMLFRRFAGHSILDEIRQTRLARLKTFLLETALPIGQISAQCGFQNEMHAKRVFKQYTGQTMRQFRRGAST